MTQHTEGNYYYYDNYVVKNGGGGARNRGSFRGRLLLLL
jgi:hypothetical protein